MTEPIWENTEAGVHYRLVRTSAYHGSGLGRVLNILHGLAGMRRHEQRIVGSSIPKIVVAASVYQLDNFWVCRTARRNGAVFVRETRDLWPMTLVELGGKSRWHPFVQWVQRAEDLGYREAKLVATTLPNSFEYMATRGLTPDRWEWLPQCPEPESSAAVAAIVPESHSAPIKSARSRGHRIVAFTGSLVPASDLGTLIQAAALLRDDPVTFVLVGQGPSEAGLRRQIAEANLGNVHMLPSVPKAAVAPLLGLCDVGIQLFAALPIYRFGVSPNKIFDYLKAGLPVILAGFSASNPVSSADAGIVVPPGDLGAIVQAVRTLNSLSEDARLAMGRRGKAHVVEYHDLGRVAGRYLELFESFRSRPRSRL